MGYLAYDLALHLLALLALPILPLLWLTRLGEGLDERLGRLHAKVRRLNRPIWIHAASVGEVLSAEPLVIALRRRYPRRPILISTTSLTGRATARAKLQPDAAMLLPIDLAWVLARVFRQLRPSFLLIVETELWPGLLRAAAAHRVPVAMVSGRISDGAARQYARVRCLTGPMLDHVQVFAMQTAEDSERLLRLGASPPRVHVVGSLKYARLDRASHHRASPLLAIVAGRTLLVAASTHPGEEDLVVDACSPLWPSHAELLLVVAPRRPERFDEVVDRLAQRGVSAERRTQVQGEVAKATRVLVLDTIGELLDLMPLARAVFVGGTVAAVGGHNVLEPALFAKPVAFGVHTEKVAAAAAALLAVDAAARVQTPAELTAAWGALLEHPDRAAAMGVRGRRVVAAQADVAERTLQLIEPLLSEVSA